MMTLLYDGSFDGLLCSLSQAIRQDIPVTIKPLSDSQISLSETVFSVETSSQLATKTYQRLKERWGKGILEDIYTAFLYPVSETLILDYLRLLIASGNFPDSVMSHPSMIDLQKRIRTVRRETHKLKGFLRFEEIAENLYYAKLAPTYDITSLLMPHFIRRFRNQRMILHDVQRAYAAFYDTKSVVYTSMDRELVLPEYASQDDYSDLWKEYIRKLAIKERENKNLQRNLMPKKYWRYMTEMNP